MYALTTTASLETGSLGSSRNVSGLEGGDYVPVTRLDLNFLMTGEP